MSDIDYHEFEEEDSCDVCGEPSDADEHDSDSDEFHHEYEHPDVCVSCGFSEADEAHQDEE